MHIIPDTLSSRSPRRHPAGPAHLAAVRRVLATAGEKGKRRDDVIEGLSHVLFGIVHIIMKLAPLGAFGAMAFTIGKYGIGSLLPLLKLIGTST